MPLIFVGGAAAGAGRPAFTRDLPIVKPAISCAALAQTDIDPPGGAPTRVVTAEVVTQGTAAPYCDVRGYVTPQVNFELRLPTQTWRRRLMFVGCGGYCGRVTFRMHAADGSTSIARGDFALVTSDLGHETPDGNGDAVWAATRQGRIDYGYRSVHVVTAAAKAIVARFYGQSQHYAYFNGCSDGGREGLMEVQRYPRDFNGVIAGAAVINDTANNTIFHAWMAQHLWRKDGSRVFTPGDLAVLHTAALAACDRDGDGIKDGVIGNPLRCRFDPAAAMCHRTETGGCLTAEQVADAKAIYAGPHDAAGRALYYGRPIGSEPDWYKFDVAPFVRSFVDYMTTAKLEPFSIWSVSYDPAELARYNADAATFNATNPDIRPFASAGGKLLMWQGWADTAVPSMSSVGYFDSVSRTFGADVSGFLRLYMLPGVGHCGGGSGPDQIDLVEPIVSWVEDGHAPDAIIAARSASGKALQRRPIYPFPETARYNGSGNPNDASAFERSRK